MAYALLMRVRVLIVAALRWRLLSRIGPASGFGGRRGRRRYADLRPGRTTRSACGQSHLADFGSGALHVLHRCAANVRAAGADSPQDPESTQMSDEVIGAMVISAAQPDLQAIRTFVRAARRLHWSNRGLTSAMHSYARELEHDPRPATLPTCAPT